MAEHLTYLNLNDHLLLYFVPLQVQQSCIPVGFISVVTLVQSSYSDAANS